MKIKRLVLIILEIFVYSSVDNPIYEFWRNTLPSTSSEIKNAPIPFISDTIPIDNPKLDSPEIDTGWHLLATPLDTHLRLGKDSVHLICSIHEETKDDDDVLMIMKTYHWKWKKKKWYLTGQDTLDGALGIDTPRLRDFNYDKLLDFSIEWGLDECDGGSGVCIYLYDKAKEKFRLVTDSEDGYRFLPNVDGGNSASIDELLRPSKDKKYYYAYYQETGNQSSERISCGYFKKFEFKEIASAWWSCCEFDSLGVIDTLIEFYIEPSYNTKLNERNKPFANIPRDYEEDTTEVTSIMIAYFEKNLPKIIQKHKALKQKRN